MEMRELSGKVAFVTGGASGIGLAMARALAEKGMKIALADVDDAALEMAVTLLSSSGARALPLHMDVRDPAAWAEAAAQVEAVLGPVHVLCNNAGVAGSRLHLAKVETAAWLWTFDINVHGVFHGFQTFVPRMCASGEDAHIVVTSSLGGLF